MQAFLAMLPLIIKLVPVIQNASRNGLTFASVLELIENKDITDLFGQLGKTSFPAATPEQATIAAIVTTFDGDHALWVQQAMNKLLIPTPALGMDGLYGRRTRAAVEVYQQAHGLKVDGWAGDKTSASIMAELVK